MKPGKTAADYDTALKTAAGATEIGIDYIVSGGGFLWDEDTAAALRNGKILEVYLAEQIPLFDALLNISTTVGKEYISQEAVDAIEPYAHLSALYFQLIAFGDALQFLSGYANYAYNYELDNFLNLNFAALDLEKLSSIVEMFISEQQRGFEDVFELLALGKFAEVKVLGEERYAAAVKAFEDAGLGELVGIDPADPTDPTDPIDPPATTWLDKLPNWLGFIREFPSFIQQFIYYALFGWVWDA
ncbi:MAG: hypothetical protein LBS96_01855 [Oscillospiraceae bacterium]|nr:hypothetical protein [Oscillospiraceae bacterium]